MPLGSCIIIQMKILLLLLITLNSFANDELNTFCFNSASELSRARKEIDFLVLDIDKINLKSNCMDIFTNTKRSNLFVKFIKRSFPSVSITSSLSSRRSCDLKITEFTKQNENEINMGVTNRSALLNKKETKSQLSKTSSMQILEDSVSKIIYQNQELNIKCNIRGESYIIEISSHSDKLSSSTTRTLAKGQKVEIGSIVKAAQGQDDSKSLSGVRFKKTDLSADTVMYLEIK